MFEEVPTQSRSQRQIILFGFQQIAVPLACLILGLGLMELFAPRGGEPQLSWPASVVYAYPALLGFPLAWLLNSRRKGLNRSGRWIWILPSLAWLWDASFSLAGMFAPTGSEGLELAFATIPALGTIFYSIAMAVSTNRKDRQAERD